MVSAAKQHVPEQPWSLPPRTAIISLLELSGLHKLLQNCFGASLSDVHELLQLGRRRVS